MGNGWTVAEILRWAGEYLSRLDVPESYMDGEYLLMHVLGCQKKDLLIHPERVLTSDEIKRFSEAIERRGRREPPQYILGEVEFREKSISDLASNAAAPMPITRKRASKR